MKLMEELWYQVKRLLSNFTHFQKRSRLKRYILPLILVVIVFLLKHYFHTLLGNNSAFLIVSFIVAASSSYGGLGPGILATLVSATWVYFAYLTADINSHPYSGDILLILIFLVEGFIISLVSEARFELEDQKEEFIGVVAHELKNPLAAVKGFAELVSANAKKNSLKKIAFFGQSINSSSDKMLELINDLLDVTKIEIGKFTYTNSFFDICELTREVISHQQMIYKKRKFTLKCISKTLLYGDRYRIGQVITNLLTNALKYSPEDTNVTVKLKENGKKIILSVKDKGLGISTGDQKKVFSRFYRTQKVQGNKSQGLGLGLFICTQIVNHHKGRLYFKSREGKGTTFFLELSLGKKE